MGILGFPFLHDFRDPVVITGTPLLPANSGNFIMMHTGGAVSCQNLSGAEWPWQIQVVESIYSETWKRNGRQRYEDKRGADGKFTFTAIHK